MSVVALVTGASGFIGGRIVEMLVDNSWDTSSSRQQWEVRVLARPSSKLHHLQPLIDSDSVKVVQGDLQDEESILRGGILDGVQVVFHCAAISSDWARPADYEATNTKGTRLLLQASVDQMKKPNAKQFIRFVHISTTDVYGYPAEGSGDETTPLCDTGLPYNHTKVAEEHAVISFKDKESLPVTIIRPVNVYGPRGRDFVVEVLDNILGGTGPLVAGGNHPCGITYIDHVVAATIRASTLPKAAGEVYNVMDTDEPLLSWRTYGNAMADAAKATRPWLYIPFSVAYYLGWGMEVVYHLLGKYNSRPLLTRHAAYILGRTAKCDASKAVRDLAYPCVSKPVSLDEGVRRSVDWYMSTRNKKSN